MSDARRSRRARFVAIGVLAIVATVVIADVAARRTSSGPTRSTARDRDAVRAYADATRAVGKRGGQLVVDSIRPTLSDLRDGRVAPAQFHTLASGWRREMGEVRRDFHAIRPPRRLRHAAMLYDDALAQYEAAIDAFAAAADRPTAERDRALKVGTDLATKADATYDRARALVDAALADVGLPTSPTIPRDAGG